MEDYNESKELARKFGKKLKELRRRKGVNMQYVADRVGVARSTYAGYETQGRFPPIDTLAKISEVLNTSTDYLIGLTDDQDPKEITRDVQEYLTNVSKLNWNGIPLSNDDIKPIKDLFDLVMRERVPKMNNDNDKDRRSAK